MMRLKTIWSAVLLVSCLAGCSGSLSYFLTRNDPPPEVTVENPAHEVESADTAPRGYCIQRSGAKLQESYGAIVSYDPEHATLGTDHCTQLHQTCTAWVQIYFTQYSGMTTEPGTIVAVIEAPRSELVYPDNQQPRTNLRVTCLEKTGRWQWKVLPLSKE